ncbi:MAG: FtsX-like permease family protein, partial [Ignavibacteriae bacterium]|nr:FtsX-like permease family protein [Ignavibacteriota bacterium]
EIAKKVFPKVDAVGKSVRVDGQNYQVIGVFQPKGQAFGGGGNIIVIPITTFFSEYGKERSVNIMVQSTSKETYDDCIEQVRGILRASRGVPPGAEDDFDIWSNDSQIREFNNVTKYVRMGILIISAIALLAAGVGVMNIMLVSVTERTREIGIRKAIGARKSNILTQFILEAIVLSELGGLLGIILGIVGGNVAAIMMEVPPVIPWDWAAIGFGICSLIGIVFGVYPAWKASNLDPIESLRYE